MGAPGTPVPTAGVRPSLGTATTACSVVQKLSNVPGGPELNARGDGRTPECHLC